MLLLSALALCQCRKQESAPEQARGAPRDPNANGERLRKAAGDWPARWAAVEALPDCAPLLSGAQERAACKNAEQALTAIQAASARNAPDAELTDLAAAAALAAQRATQHLRRAGMAELVELRRAQSDPNAPSSARPHPSATSSARPHPSATSGARPHPSPAASEAAPRQQQSPTLDAITSYARVATLGLRHLGMYLELGPVAVRRRAYDALAKLCRDEPHWAGLRVLVREAELVEADPDLKRRLGALRAQLGPG